MVLAELLQGVHVIKLFSSYFGRMALTQDISINSIQYDSRKVGNRDLFVAIKGESADGHAYLDRVIQQGAAAVVVQDDASLPDSYFLHANVFKILVPDSRTALARIAANYYRDPSGELALVGVTGTNGKTTTTHVVRAIMEAAGKRTGLIGTIGYQTGARSITATHTTPESLELNALLREMRTDGCTAAAMEVSSHALAQHRVDGLRFAAGVFTNLTQDHLDFHHSMDEYFRAKRSLFDMLDRSAVAVTNLDDPRGRTVVERTAARVWGFAVNGRADVTVEDVAMTVTGIRMNVRHAGGVFPLSSRLTGRFNVENILAGATTGLALGIAPETIQAAIDGMDVVPGRFEQIVTPAGWTVVIDYAHTPDALEKCLRTIRDLLPKEEKGRVITVFGCGGDRDRTKRPMMGKIASDLSDVMIITSDNPRTEDPEAIIDEIFTGIPESSRARRVTDRKIAIAEALNEARKGDIVLLAGKGHENYQVIGREKVHLDDHEEVEHWLNRVHS